MTAVRPELAQRVARLDGEGEGPFGPGPGLGVEGARAYLAYFMQVIRRVTGPSWPGDASTSSCMSAVEADRALEQSRLLTRLAEAAPELVTGPLRREAQIWVCLAQAGEVPRRELVLSQAYFRDLSEAALVKPSTKPFYCGLFTATAALGTYGMWHLYLAPETRSQDPPRAWHTWAVEPSARAVVREIKSACDWVDFVLSYPRRVPEHGLIFPDWRAVARDWDGVHMTLRAIAATQGFWFSTESGIVATTFWDVESTLWLRWCFEGVRLVERGP